MTQKITRGLIPKIVDKKNYNLIFVRHGNTKMNEDNDRIRGWADVPLSPKGREEADRVAKKLKDEDFDVIIGSDLKRAMETAEAISDITGKEIVAFTKGLRPWNAGVFQGKESNKIMSELQDYIRNPDKKIPKGESFNDFKERYLKEIEVIRRMFKDKTVLLVAHHRNNVVLDAWVKSGQKSNYEVDEQTLMEKGIPPAEFKKYKI